MPYNGYSEEYLDRLENGSIPADNKSYSKRKSIRKIEKISSPTPHQWNHILLLYLSSSPFVFVKLNFEAKQNKGWSNGIGSFCSNMFLFPDRKRKTIISRQVSFRPLINFAGRFRAANKKTFPIIWNFLERNCDKWKQQHFIIFQGFFSLWKIGHERSLEAFFYCMREKQKFSLKNFHAISSSALNCKIWKDSTDDKSVENKHSWT